MLVLQKHMKSKEHKEDQVQLQRKINKEDHVKKKRKKRKKNQGNYNMQVKWGAMSRIK